MNLPKLPLYFDKIRARTHSTATKKLRFTKNQSTSRNTSNGLQTDVSRYFLFLKNK